MSKKLLILAAGAAAIAYAGAADAREYKVGLVAPMSGGMAQHGDQMTKGARLYVKQHAKEIAPHTVKLIVRDSKDPSGPNAKAAAQELITRENVDILTGVTFSPNAMAMAPLATASKKPFIIMNAGTAFITNMSPNIARISFTMWQAGFIMGQHAAKEMKCKTAVSGFTNYPPGKDSVAAFKRGFESAGGKVVDEIPMGGPAQVPDFTPFYQRVIDKKPGCFYVFVPGGNHAAAVAKTYEALNMRQAGIKLIGPGDITHDTQLQGMGKAAAGVVTAIHYHADLQNPANIAYGKAFKAEYGPDAITDFVSIGGYDGMAAIFHVIKSAKGGDITGEAAIAALKGWKHESPRGPIMVDPVTRDIVQNIYVSELKYENGRLVQHVVKTFEAVKDKCKELKIGRCGK